MPRLAAPIRVWMSAKGKKRTRPNPETCHSVMDLSVHGRLLPSAKWYIGFVEELPGANTQGATLDEARANVQEAVAMILDANRELAQQSTG